MAEGAAAPRDGRAASIERGAATAALPSFTLYSGRLITSRTLQPVAAAMPTPRELKEALTSAECWPQLQKISDHARESCKEEMAEQAKREEHPGEGWRATKWLEMNKLTDLVAQILMQPLYDLAGNAAAELSFFRAFGEMGSRDLLLALMTDGRLTSCSRTSCGQSSSRSRRRARRPRPSSTRSSRARAPASSSSTRLSMPSSAAWSRLSARPTPT